MKKAEQILFKTTIQNIEVHLLALDSIASDTQLERLNALKNLLWEDVTKLCLIRDATKKEESR